MRDSILVSDTHLGSHRDSERWHEVTIRLFQDIADTCHRRNIDAIFHLGDWHDNRKALSIKTILTSLQIARMLRECKINLYIIVGNHDTFYKDRIKPHSLEFLKEFENITVIDEPVVVDEDTTLLPWNHDISNINTPHLLGHFQINNYLMNNTYECKDSMDKSEFKKFEWVISGHFHKEQSTDNIAYIGSPYQMTFNDVGDRRGYFVWNGSPEFIEFTEYPKYIKITSEDVKNEKMIPSDITGNVIKLEYTEDYGTNTNNKIIESVQIHKPLQLHTNLKGLSTTEDEEIEEIDLQVRDNKEILFNYIDKKEIPKHINKEMLKKIIENLS